MSDKIVTVEEVEDQIDKINAYILELQGKSQVDHFRIEQRKAYIRYLKKWVEQHRDVAIPRDPPQKWFRGRGY